MLANYNDRQNVIAVSLNYTCIFKTNSNQPLKIKTIDTTHYLTNDNAATIYEWRKILYENKQYLTNKKAAFL